MSKLYLVLAIVLLLCVSQSTARPGKGKGNGKGPGNGRRPGKGNGNPFLSRLESGECYKKSNCRVSGDQAVCVGGVWKGPWRSQKGVCACFDSCKTFTVTGQRRNECVLKPSCVIPPITEPAPTPVPAPMPVLTPAPAPAPAP